MDHHRCESHLVVEGDLKGSGSFTDFGVKGKCEEGEAKSGKVLVLSTFLPQKEDLGRGA